MTEHTIPAITDPLGRHWQQPLRDRVLVDETHALLEKQDFEQLLDYSRSRPTGVYVGKMWRCFFREGWFLCWYGAGDKPGTCRAHFRQLLVLE
jgi:hypothetical protein